MKTYPRDKILLDINLNDRFNMNNFLLILVHNTPDRVGSDQF
jgi:hypothetical protein